jgi:hypothetical protein
MAKSFQILKDALERKLDRIKRNNGKDPADDGPEVQIILKEKENQK